MKIIVFWSKFNRNLYLMEGSIWVSIGSGNSWALKMWQAIIVPNVDQDLWYVLSLGHSSLTHWGRVTHVCVSKLTIIGSDNGLSPGWGQAIIWTNAGILLIGPLGTNFSKILIKIQTFSSKGNAFQDAVCEMLSILIRPQCVKNDHVITGLHQIVFHSILLIIKCCKLCLYFMGYSMWKTPHVSMLWDNVIYVSRHGPVSLTIAIVQFTVIPFLFIRSLLICAYTMTALLSLYGKNLKAIASSEFEWNKIKFSMPLSIWWEKLLLLNSAPHWETSHYHWAHMCI